MRHLTLFVLLAALTSASCAEGKNDAAKRQVFRHLANDVLLPLTADFETAAGKLSESARAFCAGESSLPDVHLVQRAWRATHTAWQPLEMLQIGPIIGRRSQRQVNAWPVRPTLLAPLLASRDPVAASEVEALGAAGKGLPALEYLLFSTEQNSSASKSTLKKPLVHTHCNVLQALTQQVYVEAQGLASEWREPNGGFARQLAEPGLHKDGYFSSADQALSDTVNLLIAGIDAIKIRKLGKPLEKSTDAAALDRIESWRAGTSLDHVRDNLRGFELAFFGKSDTGIDKYLADIGRPKVAAAVRRELTGAKRALANIRPPLQQSLIKQRKDVKALLAAITRLQHVLETDVAGAFKVDLGFNANDGD